MCRLLTPNLTKASAIDEPAAASHSTRQQRGGLSGRERERQGAAASRRVLLRKKLSFSKALKNNSEGSCQEATENAPRTLVPEADSHSSLEHFIPHSTPSSEQLPSVISSPSPSIVAIGLVRQSDLPLSWLDPTSVFSCYGLYIPRETRNTLCRSLSKESESSRLDRCEINAEISANLLTSDNKTPEPPDENSTSPLCMLTSMTSPYYHGLNISPVVHLEKFPFSIPDNSCNRQSASINRRKRTASVPKDILCSLSEDSVADEEDKENRKTGDTKKLTRVKSYQSLPSSPMVLCTKLPLLRCQDNSLSLTVSPKLLKSKIREAQESAGLSTGDVTQEQIVS